MKNEMKKLATKVKLAVASKPKAVTVDEIHETFFTEVNRLLEEANIRPVAKVDKQIVDKAIVLRDMGFTGTKEVTKAKEECDRVRALKEENDKKEKLAEAINYFSEKYPLYKFITLESVKKICKKYGLVYGKVSRYKGSIPDKNVAELKAFKVQKEDACYVEITKRRFGRGDAIKTDVSYDYIKEAIPNEAITFDKGQMLIAAPASDFNMKGMQIKDFQLEKIPEPPDPVVLFPVMYADTKYFLIVTAWGDEASDELVVNQKLN